jgi:hypothetical protein
MLFCHPCGDRQTYGSRLAPHRRRETCHLSVSVVRLFGRPSLKVARHFPQSPSNPKVNRGSGHRNESFSLPTQVCTTDHVETLGKALFQVSDIAPLTFPPFSVYLMLRAKGDDPKKTPPYGATRCGVRHSCPGERSVFSGMSVIQSCGINFAGLPGSRLSANKNCYFLWSVESKRRP